MSEFGTITWQSQPVFDEWGPGAYWSELEWMQYLSALVAHFGPVAGPDVFYSQWMSRSGFWSTLFDERINWLSWNSAFRQAMRAHDLSNGVNLLVALQSKSPFSSIIGGANDVLAGAGSGMSSIGTGVSRGAKTISWLLPAAIIVAVIVAGWLLYTKTQIFTAKIT